MKDKGNLIWGIILVIIGVIFGLNAMDITNINIFFSGWWTIFIIVPSIVGIIKRPSKITNYLWLLLGIVLFLSVRGILDISKVAKLIFPSIIVIIGLGMIFKDKVETKISDKIKELNQNSEKEGLEEIYATFSGQDLKYEGEQFKGVSLNAVFGGIDLDLSKVEVSKDTLINASAVFGGIDIIVPSNVNVKVQSTSIFGGTNNKIKREVDNLPTIYVKAFCLFGGVDVK